MRRLLILVVFGVAACERIAGEDRYHVCEGDECDAGSKPSAEEVDAGSGNDSGSGRTCQRVDAGSEACAACIAKSCATAAEVCGCDPVCVSEVACYTHGQQCASCQRTKIATSELIKCATDSCGTACTSCR
jgi:hypothetical protein